MNKRVVSIVLASAVGLGAASSLALVPAFAAADDKSASVSKPTPFKDALQGLVTDGTLTQAQADKVAAALKAARPDGRHGFGGKDSRGGREHRGGQPLAEAAKVLGVTVAELRTALGSGKSLADVASSKGISKATLISKLLAAAKAHLAAEVKEGDLTQAQADKRLALLKDRIADLVDRKGLPMRPGHGERRS